MELGLHNNGLLTYQHSLLPVYSRSFSTGRARLPGHKNWSSMRDCSFRSYIVTDIACVNAPSYLIVPLTIFLPG